MPFVNEYILKEDFERYGFKERDDANPVGATRSDQWTIDRERGMFLRAIARGREETIGTTYCFFWRDHWTNVRLAVVECAGTHNAPQWIKYALVDLELPKDMELLRDQYLADLKEALLAYKDFGVRSTATEFTASFDF